MFTVLQFIGFIVVLKLFMGFWAVIFPTKETVEVQTPNELMLALAAQMNKPKVRNPRKVT